LFDSRTYIALVYVAAGGGWLRPHKRARENPPRAKHAPDQV